MRYLCLKKKSPFIPKAPIGSLRRNKKSAVAYKSIEKVDSKPERESEREEVVISSVSKENEREVVKQ